MTDEESARLLVSQYLKEGLNIKDLIPRLGNNVFSLKEKTIAHAKYIKRKQASVEHYLKNLELYETRRWRDWGINRKQMSGRDRARMLVRIRDKFICQDCKKVRTPFEVKERNKNQEGLKGRIKLFDVHHVNGLCGKISRGYDSCVNIEGMITLCHKCHYNRPEHTVKSEKFSKKLRNKYKKQLATS